MHRWLLSVETPALRLALLRRRVARRPALGAALAALAGSLALGWSGGPALPGYGSAVLAALAAIGGVGLVAWLLARLSALPLADPARAALAAALIPAMAAPGTGFGALVLPSILSLWLGWRRPDQRPVALMVHCGAIAAWALSPVNHMGACSLTVTILGIACFLALKALSGAANDNPSLERIEPNNPLWRLPGHDNDAPAPIPGKWGVSNVQQ